ncbi:MAG: hypothetical protein A4E23_01328 [Methanomethylovorans sp. PtaU1.Bin073]|nr:MAG: hypothetical protein A4E23_01328 [Methanomethylovorans sp. PtaU1.Bin073]
MHKFGRERETDPTWDAGMFTPNPVIDIEKYTNDQDADTAPGPTILKGEAVTWTYVVTNTGNVDLTDVVVKDNKIDLGTAGTIGSLAAGESKTITVSDGIAIAGQYENTATATGYYGTTDVSDIDPSHYLGVQPAIDIEKATNSIDADDPTGPTVLAGETVTWTYVVTNTGDVPLENILVTDDVLGNIGTIASLDVGKSQTLTATGIATAGQYENTGTASAKYSADFGSTTVSDADMSHYFGAAPSIDIEKATNGEDADSPLGVLLKVGVDSVTWTYVVTNTGNVPLTNVVVTDNKTGSVGTIASLAVGESQTLTVKGGTATVVGQYTNLGTVTGDYVNPDDGTTTVTDSDPSNYFGFEGPGTGTPGYWMNHPEAWPVDTISIGGATYTKDQAIAEMAKAVKDDKTYSMFPALVSAKLNVLVGNTHSCIDGTIDSADVWMQKYPLGSGIKASSPAWKEGEPLFKQLDMYNNGKLCSLSRDIVEQYYSP